MITGTVLEIEPANRLSAGEESDTNPVAVVAEDNNGISMIPLDLQSPITAGSRVGITKCVSYIGKGSKTTYRLVPLL